MTDEEEIRQLIGAIMMADADKDVDGFAATFTEEGTYHSGSRGSSSGTAALKKNLADRNKYNPPERETVHLACEGSIKVQGDRASAVAPYVAYGRIGLSPWNVMSIGRFECELVRRDGRWLFTEVNNHLNGKSTWPATAQHHPHVENP